MSNNSVRIINALIIDGSGASPYLGEVSLAGGVLTSVSASTLDCVPENAVGPSCVESSKSTSGAISGPASGKHAATGNGRQDSGEEVYDAKGLAVCPGFIDTHSHSGLKVLFSPAFPEKITQGITTELLGQDGVSVVPLRSEDVPVFQENVDEVEGGFFGYDFSCSDTRQYLERLAAAKPLANYAWLVPHGNVRMAVIGNANRKATPQELEAMCSLLRRELAAGAFGMSGGLIYPPGSYADEDELIALCRVVAEFEGIFAVHQRSESDAIVPSMEELMRVAKASGVRLHISHFKICGMKNQKLFPAVAAILSRARSEGVRVSLDQYPYAAGCTSLNMILPPWAMEGGVQVMLANLKDQTLRKKIIDEILRRNSMTETPGRANRQNGSLPEHSQENALQGAWDNFYDFAGQDGIFITKAKRFVGCNLTEISTELGVAPLEAALLVIEENEGAATMVDHYGTEETLIEIMRLQEQNFCTDAVLGDSPHPRAFGAYARVLGRYVRELRVMPLAAAIHKMTGKPAQVLGLTDRGLLRNGYAADLVIFSPEAITDCATYENPNVLSQGIERVYVNGELAVEQGKVVGKGCGRVLRKP